MKKLLILFGLVMILGSTAYAQDYEAEVDVDIKVKLSGSFQGFDVDSDVNVKGIGSYARVGTSLKGAVSLNMLQDGENTVDPYNYKMYLEKNIAKGLEEMGLSEDGLDTGLFNVFISATDSEGKETWNLDAIENKEAEQLFIDYDVLDNVVTSIIGKEHEKKVEGTISYKDLKERLEDLKSSIPVEELGDVFASDLASNISNFEDVLFEYKVEYDKKGLLKKIDLGVSDAIDLTSIMSEGMEDIENFKAMLDEASITCKVNYKNLDASVPDDVRKEAEENYNEVLQGYLDNLLEGQTEEESENISE